MTAWRDKAAELTKAIEDAGVRPTMDPRKVNPPCALLVPPDLERVTACGVFAAWTVHLVAPGAQDLDAAAWLLDHVEAVFNAVGGYTAEYGSLTINPESDPLPAYTITVVAQAL
jgi:hypothetical protein